MVNINSKAEARKRIRQAQKESNESRVERERLNADDAASFLVELGRLGTVDEWERNRILEVRAEGERRRHERRVAGAAALALMQGRGETLAAIAELAGVKVGEVRAMLTAGGAAVNGADGAAGGAAVNGADRAAGGAAVQTLGVGAPPADGVGGVG